MTAPPGSTEEALSHLKGLRPLGGWKVESKGGAFRLLRRNIRVRSKSNVFVGLFLIQLFCSLPDLATADTQPQRVFRYNVCNGLSNQLLLHASGIARAIESQSSVVQVPDYFIVNGEQTSDEQVSPTNKNSVPLSRAFDIELLQRRVQELGIRIELIRWDEEKDSAGHGTTMVTNNSTQSVITCERLSSLAGANPELILKVIQAFQPSSTIRTLTKTIMASLAERGLDQGVCFHHRNGQDWHDHCERWGNASLEDGIYRGNCKAVNNNRSLVQLLEDRALTSPDRWVYYCGDHEVPTELKVQTNYTILSKDQFMSEQNKQAVQAIKPGSNVRDIWALMDYSICGSLPFFVGNSVSTFTALQIASRQQEGSYWYNSQNIPLGDVWDIYQIPVVYSYTELSDPKGKYMLQASISSLRQHMPHNKISILYHGKQDVSFQQWLRNRNVTVFEHDPEWKQEIDKMRVNGNANSSHLFLHAGNYFGTWQRIDIPKFIETEYCLLLDADTVIMQPFTLKDFGLNLTQSIGMSAERHRHHKGNLLNAGVTLMNVPHMRATYDEFLKFIMEHVNHPAYHHPAPSDQGAYLEFYEATVQQISNFWNWKSYWGVKVKNNMFRKIKIVHFHGIKPHDFVKKLLGYPCDNALADLCPKFKLNIFRVMVNRFLLAAASIPEFNRGYCEASFNTSEDQSRCSSILHGLEERDFNQYAVSGNERQKKHPQEQQQRDDQQIINSSENKKRMRSLGFWDKKVVTVSRPANGFPEEENIDPPRKMHELSYAYMLSDEINSQNEEQTATLARMQYRLLLLIGSLSFFFTKVYSIKNRRFVFVFFCGAVVCHRILHGRVFSS